MTWSEIPNRTGADANSFTDINQLQDNLNALKGGTATTAPTTTIEDLASAAQGTLPIVRVRKSSSQAISASTVTTITWQTELEDNLNYFNLTTSKFEPTIPSGETHYFNFNLLIGFSSNLQADKRFALFLYKNGAFLIDYDFPITGVAAPLIGFNHIEAMENGDVMSARIFHTGTASKTIPATNSQAQFNITRYVTNDE